jgi:hypothetical protein
MDRHFNAKLEEFMARLRQKAALREASESDIQAAEQRLRDEYAEGRKAGFVRHLGACGVPEELLEPYRNGIQARPVLQAVKQWVETGKPTLLLLGSNGIGKSVAAAYALRLATTAVWKKPDHPMADAISVERLDSGEGYFLTAAGLRFASRYTDGKALSTLDRAATVKVLVLDELRAEDFQGKGLERLEEILSERMAHRARTVITSNLTLAELRECSGPRIASRIGGADVFETGGQDLRRVKP